MAFFTCLNITVLSLPNNWAICNCDNHMVSAITDTGNETAPSRDSNSTISFLPITTTLLSHFDMYANGINDSKLPTVEQTYH